MLNDQPRKRLLQRVSILGIKVDPMISQLTFKPDPIVLYVLMELAAFTFIHGPMNGAFIFQSFFPIYFVRHVLVPSVIYLFSGDTATNYHKFRGLKKHRKLCFHNSGCQKSKINVTRLKSGCLLPSVPGGSEYSFTCGHIPPLSAPMVPKPFPLCAPFSLLSPSNLLLSLSYKNTWGGI